MPAAVPWPAQPLYPAVSRRKQQKHGFFCSLSRKQKKVLGDSADKRLEAGFRYARYNDGELCYNGSQDLDAAADTRFGLQEQHFLHVQFYTPNVGPVLARHGH